MGHIHTKKHLEFLFMQKPPSLRETETLTSTIRTSTTTSWDCIASYCYYLNTTYIWVTCSKYAGCVDGVTWLWHTGDMYGN